MKKIMGFFSSSRQDVHGGHDTRANGNEVLHPVNGEPEQMSGISMSEQTENAATDPLGNLPDPVVEMTLVDGEILGEPSPEVMDGQARAVAELGGRHELIGARLGQIGEILQQLNDAHKLVELLASPLSSTFRHHQILAGQNIALQHALVRVNDEVSILREREVSATARATSLALELRHLADARSQTEEQQTRMEEELRQTSGEIRNRDVMISDLERQIGELAVEAREFKDDLEQANASWQKSAALEGVRTQQLREEREKFQALEQEHVNLKASLQQTMAEAAQLSRQLAESQEKVASLKARSLETEEILVGVRSEKDRLSEKLSQFELSMAEERRSLAIELEGIRGRSETLDRMLTQAREELGVQAETLREAVQQGAELKNANIRLESRHDKLVADLQKKEEENRHLTEVNASLTDRIEAQGKVIHSKDEALQRNKDVLESQAERLGTLEGRSFSQVESYERQVANLTATIEQEKAERALLEGTLEAMRQEKQRLQKQLIRHRSNLVDDSSADMVRLGNMPYPTVETLIGLVPKPSIEAPVIVAHQPEPAREMEQAAPANAAAATPVIRQVAEGPA